MSDQNGAVSVANIRAPGSLTRFERRWHLIGAGLSNVWRFGDLELPAASGRLLLRGPNGTGKTTALEALWPYLLDLNAARLAAGKARPTTLSSLMREGAPGKRRYGYAWLTLNSPTDGVWSFGVRLQYAEGASPPVKVIPFAVPGRPLHEIPLHGPGRVALTPDEFEKSVFASGGQLFNDEDEYVSHLAARLFATADRDELPALAARLRHLRNPTLLGDVSPQVAADALRESLPGVADDVIAATAEALAESDATRDAFARDTEAADLLASFRDAWCAHASEVVGNVHAEAVTTAARVRGLQRAATRGSLALENAGKATAKAKERVEQLESDIAGTGAEIAALEEHQAYKDARRLQDLQETLQAQDRAAAAAAKVMEETAGFIAAEAGSVSRELGNLNEDLTECLSQASEADIEAVSGAALLSWSYRPRAIIRVGGRVADAGPQLLVDGDSKRLREAASSWIERAAMHAHQAEAATLALSDHASVEHLQGLATDAAKEAERTAERADKESITAKRSEIEAREAATRLLVAIASWTRHHAVLAEPLRSTVDDASQNDAGNGSPWDVDDIERLSDVEPGHVLISCDSFAQHAISRGEHIAAGLRARADEANRTAAALRGQAVGLRSEVSELRRGRLLPLPRPEWAGIGDDSIALGAVLEWCGDAGDPRDRALLEATLGAAGLLGAALGTEGATTRLWQADASGPTVEPNLLDFVTVDAAHPLAATASAVLARVHVAPTATRESPLEPSAVLVIGRDGTFSAGVLAGRVPGADDSAQLPPARHIGARQRRAAALARADELDGLADDLDAKADGEQALATQLETDAISSTAASQSFPLRSELRSSESRRAATARIARDAGDAAAKAGAEAESLRHEAQRARMEWLERTRARGLPGDVPALVAMKERGATTSERLRAVARTVADKIAPRLDRVLARQSEPQIVERLNRVEADARLAFRDAVQTKTTLDVLKETAGAAIADIRNRHDVAVTRQRTLQGEIAEARAAQLKAAGDEGAARTTLDEVEEQLRDAQPKATQQLRRLRLLLAVPGVTDAVLDGEAAGEDSHLLPQVEAKLQGRRTISKKTVRERADTARAKLAGIWSIDPGDDYGELLTYVLTHRDTPYSPTQAAAYAASVKQRAARALAAAEERALRDFVIGRLPSAISTGWTRLHDWVTEVNRKMRAAAASSGVRVSVHVPLRDDLAPAARTVYELSCKVTDASRTEDQARRLAAALQALIDASDGETMQQRVASAVNVRDWVDVYYEITRSEGRTQRWSSKTGLSGGERRLIVLAPMLAAIAAAYDRFGERALRLVALDEVPAEVDERGREGLARYIADLDLDLVCTSYLWDGCPGAWDGIDAHDLEAGPDGTVVAFPMLIRGVAAIPEVLVSNAPYPDERRSMDSE